MLLDVRDRRTQREDQGQAEAPPKPNKGKTIIMILFMVIVAFVIVLGGLVLFGDQVMETVAGIWEGPPYEEHAHVMPLSEFTVNLAGEGRTAFLRAEMHLAFEDGDIEQEIKDRKPEVRTEIITLLRGKTAENLAEPMEEDEEGGLEMLREEITDKLNQILVSGDVETVYFKEFVIQ